MLKDDPTEGKAPITVELLIEALMAMPPDALVAIPDMHNEELRSVAGVVLCERAVHGDVCQSKFLHQHYAEYESFCEGNAVEDTLVLRRAVIVLPLGIGWKESP